jgi:uncharacterized Zn-binding protein involved in type VI secretion
MKLGYFIRLGDKTSCGGTVLGGERGVTLLGVPRSREGDRVSCGKSTGEFHIVGGVEQLKSNGRRVAGSLDSTSSCACNALLIPSSFSTQYESLRPVKHRHGPLQAPPRRRGNGQGHDQCGTCSRAGKLGCREA